MVKQNNLLQTIDITSLRFDDNSGRIVDRFGNGEIHLLIDGDGDGKIGSHLNPIGDYDIIGSVHAFMGNPKDENDYITSWERFQRK